jgi:NCAIR mutase (PurE)-related protein
VAVICGGGADTPVAAEVAFAARVSGSAADRHDDDAGSRVRALLADPDRLPDADCLVVVAGMDAALVTTLGSLTDRPVVAVPTSAGAAAGLGGLAPLLTMLGAAAPGIAVVGVDNGWSAGVFAARVARRVAR